MNDIGWFIFNNIPLGPIAPWFFGKLIGASGSKRIK